MKKTQLPSILHLTLLFIGLLGFLFLVNAFFGKVTTLGGKVVEKRIVKNEQGYPFYRVFVKSDSGLVQVQTQPHDYPTINLGDSVTYKVRKGLFIHNIIETYNAKLK
jgi:hypothetical protein